MLLTGVLTSVQKSQYGTPLFITPKKESTVSFIAEYLRLNQKLVRNTYPLPRIGETMQKLEGLQYATSLYLSMGYYNIRLSLAIQYITTIVTEFGKFKYNRLPMGMCAPGDIFPDKLDEILGDIKGVKTYIDDILVLREDIFENHIDQMRIVFGRLFATGLKVDVPK